MGSMFRLPQSYVVWHVVCTQLRDDALFFALPVVMINIIIQKSPLYFRLQLDKYYLAEKGTLACNDNLYL